jgi:maltose phosphorylase
VNGFDGLMDLQRRAWETIWDSSDITIEGDLRAQQGIRFNIFQLNQTYLGKDHRLNIGPKGFTGEKYGGSTYWDTEAYCLPFYMATKGQEVGRNLLKYRYDQLEQAIGNGLKLGLGNGAALYPMVTMDGEESHNEWEITFEEIHRNGAIVYAIAKYVNYTGDYAYIPAMGMEVMIGVARFWRERAHISPVKDQYVILGVTGPNEYENNVNNNWYTNYLARWCINYTIDQIEKVKQQYRGDYERVAVKTGLQEAELIAWKEVADHMYFPWSEDHGIFLQQDGFLDKEPITANDVPVDQRPVNQHWSWDRILRSPLIKQADVLQGFYFFEDHFSREELDRHFDFYEPLTVHESSLSPCIHSILASSLGRIGQAYEFYLRTSRLDLDDYNREVHEGLHITSMAGTWLSVVEGFGGMRVKDDTLSFSPRKPKQWKSFSFKIRFRGCVMKVLVADDKVEITSDRLLPFPVLINDQKVDVVATTELKI